MNANNQSQVKKKQPSARVEPRCTSCGASTKRNALTAGVCPPCQEEKVKVLLSSMNATPCSSCQLEPANKQGLCSRCTKRAKKEATETQPKCANYDTKGCPRSAQQGKTLCSPCLRAAEKKLFDTLLQYNPVAHQETRSQVGLATRNLKHTHHRLDQQLKLHTRMDNAEALNKEAKKKQKKLDDKPLVFSQDMSIFVQGLMQHMSQFSAIPSTNNVQSIPIRYQQEAAPIFAGEPTQPQHTEVSQSDQFMSDNTAPARPVPPTAMPSTIVDISHDNVVDDDPTSDELESDDDMAGHTDAEISAALLMTRL